jgi:hypothetical protein
MEFKTLLDALIHWTNQSTPQTVAAQTPPAAIPLRDKIPPPYTPAKKQERVEGGDILRKPIDRVAARVVAEAPWYFKSPDVVAKVDDVPTKKRKRANKPPKTRKMKWITEETLRDDRTPPHDKIRREDMVQQVIEALHEHDRELKPFIRAAINAVGAMSDAVRNVGSDMDAFEQGLKKWQGDIRTARMNFVSESGFILNGLKEVRQFFGGNAYEQQMARLSELAELCERLKKLRDDGVIDSLSDTIIRLSLKEEMRQT